MQIEAAAPFVTLVDLPGRLPFAGPPRGRAQPTPPPQGPGPGHAESHSKSPARAYPPGVGQERTVARAVRRAATPRNRSARCRFRSATRSARSGTSAPRRAFSFSGASTAVGSRLSRIHRADRYGPQLIQPQPPLEPTPCMSTPVAGRALQAARSARGLSFNRSRAFASHSPMFSGVTASYVQEERFFGSPSFLGTLTVGRPYSASGRRRAASMSRRSSSAVSARRCRRRSARSFARPSRCERIRHEPAGIHAPVAESGPAQRVRVACPGRHAHLILPGQPRFELRSGQGRRASTIRARWPRSSSDLWRCERCSGPSPGSQSSG